MILRIPTDAWATMRLRAPSQSNESAGIRVNDCAPVLVATQWTERPFAPTLPPSGHSAARVQDIDAVSREANPVAAAEVDFTAAGVPDTVVANECIQFLAERDLYWSTAADLARVLHESSHESARVDGSFSAISCMQR
jgi:hypothetical protein